MGGMIACLAAIENQETLSGLILESAAIEMHPKTASWTVRTAAKILSKDGLHEPEFKPQIYGISYTIQRWTGRLTQ